TVIFVAETNCTLVYYATEVEYSEAAQYQYYFTSTNIKSVDECAAFCYNRKFCHTAVYNYFASTCSISYDRAVNCQIPYKFLDNNSFDVLSEARELSPPKLSVAELGREDQRGNNLGKSNSFIDTELSKEYGFQKLPEKYINRENGYLYRVQLEDINENLRNQSEEHEIRRKENKKEIDARPGNRNESNLINVFILFFQVFFSTCRCACAKTWKDETNCTVRCKSFQYSNSRQNCILNSADHTGDFDLIYTWNNDYYYRTCDKEGMFICLRLIASSCQVDGIAPVSALEFGSENEEWNRIINEEIQKDHTTKKRSTTDNPSTSSIVLNDTNFLHWWQNTRPAEMSKKAYASIEDELFTSGPLRKKSWDQKSSLINVTWELNLSKFWVIDGYVLKGTAGGLEQDVTLEECKCHCVNSRISGRYSFQCMSATYYHKERDCVLNLQTRNDISEKFHQQHNVSYLETICSVGNTDACFLEMPNHVLEGTAFAAETNASLNECKCYCMNSERQYGAACYSVQYYFNSRTCLLNNNNPNNFSYLPASTLLHSYFDRTCFGQSNVLISFLT
ncbi:unnamed protein product, partial [Thelazia callipaeda]|uniref:Apple domain-containing protein n=1 Tax=Thelazia callipaeda TaxID=103827 RepID=A0A158RB18_THECL